MDGLSTFVLSYQDASGAIFTSRVITNNPNASLDEFNTHHLDRMFKAGGYELLSVQKLDELMLEVVSPIGRRMNRAVLYRWALLGALSIACANLWLNMTHSEEIQKTHKAVADRGGQVHRLHTRIDQLEHQHRLTVRRLGKVEDQTYR